MEMVPLHACSDVSVLRERFGLVGAHCHKFAGGKDESDVA